MTFQSCSRQGAEFQQPETAQLLKNIGLTFPSGRFSSRKL